MRFFLVCTVLVLALGTKGLLAGRACLEGASEKLVVLPGVSDGKEESEEGSQRRAIA